jgi:hypothetical protein
VDTGVQPGLFRQLGRHVHRRRASHDHAIRCRHCPRR